MRNLVLLISCCLVVVSTWAQECDDAVDLADSLDFHKMHVECDDDEVEIYNSKSKSFSLSQKRKVVDTYGEKTQQQPALITVPEETDSGATQPAIAEQKAVNNAGVRFNIREAFSMTDGPHSAINNLFQQMGSYCPQGWEKLKEWVEPAESHLYLHYQFQCAN